MKEKRKRWWLINKVILKGNITKDIELRHTGSGVAVATFIIATKRNYKNQNGEYESDFIRCVAYRETAELISKHFSKGSGIIIEGQIKTGSYESEGKKVFTTDVMVEHIEFVDKKENNNPYEEMGKKVEEEYQLPF